MRVGKRLFPYPVLNNQSNLSTFMKSYFQFDFNIIQNDGFFIIENVAYITDNETLESLIKQGKAKVVCIVECSASIYRKEFPITNEKTNINIPIHELRDKVVISAYAYAVEDIHDYHDFDFIEDYSEYKFQINKYAILAVDDGFTTRIKYDESEDDKVSSIFLIIKDESNNSENIRIQETPRKINIYLPGNQFDIYDKMKFNEHTKQIFFSFFIVPALMYVFEKIKNRDIEEVRMDYEWFLSIEKKFIEIYGEDIEEDSLSNISSIEFAQRIMNFPVTKAVDEVFHLTMNTNLGDEYDE